MSNCVWHIETKDNVFVLWENFLTLLSVEKTTGDYLANSIISMLNDLGIDCSYLVGQGYDSASCMKDSFNGVQAIKNILSKSIIYVLKFPPIKFSSESFLSDQICTRVSPRHFQKGAVP